MRPDLHRGLVIDGFQPTVDFGRDLPNVGMLPLVTAALNRASRIGTVADLSENLTRRRIRVRKAESINVALVAA